MVILGRVLLQHKLAFCNQKNTFKVVYGKKPTSLLSYIRGTAKAVAVEQELLHRDCIVKNLKVNPKEAQAQINKSTICFTKKSG